MRILVVSPYVPFPPINGGRMRIWAILRYLAQRHEVSLAALVDPGEEEAPRELHDTCCEVRLVRRGPLRPDPEERLPPPILTFRSELMIEALRELGEREYDVVLFEHLFTAPYAKLFPSTLAVLDEHNVESSIYRRIAELPSDANATEQAAWLSRATSLHMQAYERRTWPRFPLRFTVSAEDDAEMGRWCRVGRSLVVPNGIDLEAYQPLGPAPTTPPSVLFMASLEYPPNIDAAFVLADEVLPRLRSQVGDATAVIAGRRPVSEVLALGQRPGVRVIADPPDMTPIAERCAVCVVPLRSGGGTRLKILHAFALGRPVVSTALGAEGLLVEDGRDLLIHDQPDEMARAIQRLFESPELRKRLTGNGLAVAKRYAWTDALVPLETSLVEEVERFAQASKKPKRSSCSTP